MNTLVALSFMFACGSPSEGTAPENGATPQEKVAKQWKAKTKGKARAPLMDPVGAAGPVGAALQLEPTPAEGEGELPRTQATLALSWGDGEQKAVDLGSMGGTCVETEAQPIGREGHERVPLWALRCNVDNQEPTKMYIVQIGAMVSLVQEVKGTPADDAAPAQPRWRPITRIPLVKGATLERGS